MNRTRLIHDANQIARYFSAYPENEAIAGIADHIDKFWDPRMRTALRAVCSEREAGLDGLVVQAAARLKS